MRGRGRGGVDGDTATGLDLILRHARRVTLRSSSCGGAVITLRQQARWRSLATYLRTCSTDYDQRGGARGENTVGAPADSAQPGGRVTPMSEHRGSERLTWPLSTSKHTYSCSSRRRSVHIGFLVHRRPR